MPYCEDTDLNGLIPPEWRIASTDDDGSSNGEAMPSVLVAASEEIDGVLSTRYPVPVNLEADQAPVALLKHCCRYLVKSVRKTLDKIAAGTIPLFPNAEPAGDDAVAITEDSRVHSKKISF